MDEDNRSEPAVQDVDGMTSDDITTIVTQLADIIPSSESEDDELDHTTHVMKTKETLPRLDGHIDDIAAVSEDEQFKLRFRISRSTFEYILAIITPKMKTARPLRIPLEKQLLITLSLMATVDSTSSVSKRFNINRTSVRYCLNKVLFVLCDLVPSIITWPSGNNVNVIRDGFKNMSGFPNVIGVVDSITIPYHCFHPELLFYQWPNKNSIQLQAVCDHTGRFIHCFTGECQGSMTCQDVLQSSKLLELLENDEKFPANCYILGDATYKLHEKVIVPYHDNGHLTSEQINFNSCHSKARVTIKQAFGLLKTRFCSIRDGLTLRKLDSISNFVTACCVIHNICLSNGDQIEYCLIDDATENTPFHQDTESPEAY